MFFAGEVNKGAAQSPFPWEKLQQSRMQEFVALGQQMDREAKFQTQEQAVMAQIYNAMAEQGKAEFLPGDQQRFKSRYEEEKQKLMKDLENYSSVQAFMADAGAEKLTTFTQGILGSEEYSNGIFNKGQYEAYMQAKARGEIWFKPSVGKDATGQDVAFNTPDEALGALEEGKISRFSYGGNYAKEWDSSKLRTQAGAKDILYTPTQVREEMLAQGMAPQFVDQYMKQYNQEYKGGRGFYQFKRDPSLDIQQQQLANERLQLALAAQKEQNKEYNFWTKSAETGGVTPALAFGSDKPLLLEGKPAHLINVGQVFTENFKDFGITKLTAKNEANGNSTQLDVYVPDKITDILWNYQDDKQVPDEFKNLLGKDFVIDKADNIPFGMFSGNAKLKGKDIITNALKKANISNVKVVGAGDLYGEKKAVYYTDAETIKKAVDNYLKSEGVDMEDKTTVEFYSQMMPLINHIAENGYAGGSIQADATTGVKLGQTIVKNK